MAKDLEYTIDSNFDYTIDEKGNKYIALRKIDWGNNGEYKLDLRKYYTNSEGEERMSSGVVLNDDAANELTNILVEQGYGDDEQLANTILNNRPEVVDIIKNGGTTEEDYYDPMELIA